MSPVATICVSCGHITPTTDHGRCPTCAQWWHQRDNERRNAKPQHRIWNGKRWHRCRTKVYMRDGYTCVDCGRHKDDLNANERLIADHVQGLRTILSSGQDPYAPSLCATRCSTCSGRKDGGMR